MRQRSTVTILAGTAHYMAETVLPDLWIAVGATSFVQRCSMYKVRSARASRRKLSGARFARVTAIGTHPNPAGSSVPASNEPVGRHHIKANPLANGAFWDRPFTERRNNRTVASLKKAVYCKRHLSPTAVRLTVF